MITDEQKTLIRDLLIGYGIDISIDVSTSWVNEIISSITIDQIEQLAKQHNISVIEWIKFDPTDESTHPEEFDVVITNKGVGMFHLTEGWEGTHCPHFEIANFDKGFCPHFEIEYWQPLPIHSEHK